MLLLLILIVVVAIFFSMQNKKMEKMKKETPNLYRIINCISYGIVFLIVALATSKWWLITLSWIIVVGCFITAITAIVSYFKKAK